MSKNLIKILLLISFSFIIYKNEQYSLFIILFIILEVSNLEMYGLLGLLGVILVILSLMSKSKLRDIIFFIAGCALMLVYLIPYFEHYKRILKYFPSLVTFIIYCILLVLSIFVVVFQNKKQPRKSNNV